MCFYLLSQKTPLLSPLHLHALELKDTQKTHKFLQCDLSRRVGQQHNIPLFTAQVFNIKHVCKVNIQMLTCLKVAKRLEQEVAGNINNFKRPSLHGDIYRVQRGGGGDPCRNAFITMGYAGQS